MNMVSRSNEVCIHKDSIVSLKFTVTWKNESGRHQAIQYIERFNVWRDMDLLPKSLIDDLIGHTVGKGQKHFFTAGDLVPAWQDSLKKTLPLDNIKSSSADGERINPIAGRFYPAGMFSGINDVYKGNMQPVRIVGIWEDKLVVDFNHPLALEDISIQFEVMNILPATVETGGRCSDAIEMMLSNGTGMQLTYPRTQTEFFIDEKYERLDEEVDSVFYEQERKVHHLDKYARKEICDIYSSVIKSGDRVLDLMSSWESHISEQLTGNHQTKSGTDKIHLSGLGMNAEELKSNPQLNDYIVHDLNTALPMPYEDELFDVVVCTASVEYLINPVAVFKDVYRILKPGGKFILTFSNRWFPTKAIKLWSEIHDFERIGLVAEYFRKSAWTGSIDTLSSRGLARHIDDPHYDTTHISDPVYMVCSEK